MAEAQLINLNCQIAAVTLFAVSFGNLVLWRTIRPGIEDFFFVRFVCIHFPSFDQFIGTGELLSGAHFYGCAFLSLVVRHILVVEVWGASPL